MSDYETAFECPQCGEEQVLTTYLRHRATSVSDEDWTTETFHCECGEFFDEGFDPEIFR